MSEPRFDYRIIRYWESVNRHLRQGSRDAFNEPCILDPVKLWLYRAVRRYRRRAALHSRIRGLQP